MEVDAGRNTVLGRVVSLHLEHTTIGGLLAEIQRQTGLTFALPLADGRELELTRERGQPAEVFRLAMFRRYGAYRMSSGGFCCTRAELALLLMAWDRSTPAAPDQMQQPGAA